MLSRAWYKLRFSGGVKGYGLYVINPLKYILFREKGPISGLYLQNSTPVKNPQIFHSKKMPVCWTNTHIVGREAS